MKIKDAVILVTGANRGLGLALVREALAGGAKRVYATARDPKQLEALVRESRDRIVPLALDIEDAASLAAAALRAPDVTMLINNAGVLASYNLLASRHEDIARDFATNTFGMLAATKAFLPALERAGGAALVNVLSIVSLSNMPAIGGYSASKAAAYSFTQGLRGELGKKHISVHAVLAGAIDTDMVRAMEMPKTSAKDVAKAIIDGVEQGLEDIYPDPASRGMSEVWRRDPKALERQLGAS